MSRILGLDVSTKTIGISLFEDFGESGKLQLLTHITPKVKPIRGGTDGSRLSYMGLPCPNIFAGGHNFHGRFEYVPVPSMEKATMLILKIANLLTQKQSNTYTTN